MTARGVGNEIEIRLPFEERLREKEVGERFLASMPIWGCPASTRFVEAGESWDPRF
jgi:hypothetical protein